MKIKLLALVALSLGFFACSDEDNPASDQMEHFEAYGMIIYQSGAKVLDYFGPDYDPGTTMIGDTLTIDQGLTPHWEVQFYDPDRNVIAPPTDADKSFGAAFNPPSAAELWWHEGEEGSFEFHIRGLEAGFATVEFHVLHGDHADFSTLPVPLVVSEKVSHDAPVGVKLLDETSGDLLATAWLADSAKVEGELAIADGETTDHIEAVFFDKYGVEFHPGVPPHSLVVESGDSKVARVGGQTQAEPWAFTLEGVSAGSTSIVVNIYHDGAVGKTFTAVPVTVR
ncbi:MAG: hypothetical protein GF419_07120 [Ignavibacteriales bacterium]|nr:hypothetical protein [Ignavibacteriales bacterium]